MNIANLLNIVSEGLSERIAVQDENKNLTYSELEEFSNKLAKFFQDEGYDVIAMLGTNSVEYPALFFAAAKAGIPFVPLNYRLTDTQLENQSRLLGNSLLVTDNLGIARLSHIKNLTLLDRTTLFQRIDSFSFEQNTNSESPAEAACWLFTSGTTGEPKTAVLKHENLSAYILSTIDPMSSLETDSVLVSVPPYHIAGLAGILSNIFSGRRIVYLESFTPEDWVATVIKESITQAMVVPTMMQRILALLRTSNLNLPSLRSLSYGGGRMPLELINEAMNLLPEVGFTNAYGLTETSSSIAILTPQEHREAFNSDEPEKRARLGSVGKVLPGVELQIRDEIGEILPSYKTGEIWVRGAQVAGEYRGKGSMLVDGWFCTRDEGWLDSAGYLFLLGRVDDVIVRGGENISPGEIEDVIRTHPSVCDVAVVAMSDEEWGEVPVAFVVTQSEKCDALSTEIQNLVHKNLRSSRVPSQVIIVDALPYNETGKLLRNSLRAKLKAT
jgi:acyl-CoA synthetase (AMP-forming)/AMP-acid ligase II